MEALDRLGWADGLSFVTYGVRVGIRVNQPSILQQVPAFFPPTWKPCPSPTVQELYSLIVGSNGPESRVRRYNLLYLGSAQLMRTMRLADLFETLEAHLHLVVALRARGKLFVRAGVVGWQGRAVVIPGDDLRAMTSCVAALVHAGAVYYSNTYAVFDGRGQVHAYPTPLRGEKETRGTDQPFSRRGSAVDAIPPPLPVGVIAFPGHHVEAPGRSRPVSPAQAVLALLRYAIASRYRPKFALRVLSRVTAGAMLRAIHFEREEPDASAVQLLEGVSARHPFSQAWL